jgi:hypothetical protein
VPKLIFKRAVIEFGLALKTSDQFVVEIEK